MPRTLLSCLLALAACGSSNEDGLELVTPYLGDGGPPPPPGALGVASPLPREADGIASKFPGDVGLAEHSSVVLYEDFDAPAIAAVLAGWTDVNNGFAMTAAADVPPDSGDGVSVKLTGMIGGTYTGGHLYRTLPAGLDELSRLIGGPASSCTSSSTSRSTAATASWRCGSTAS